MTSRETERRAASALSRGKRQRRRVTQFRPFSAQDGRTAHSSDTVARYGWGWRTGPPVPRDGWFLTRIRG